MRSQSRGVAFNSYYCIQSLLSKCWYIAVLVLSILIIVFQSFSLVFFTAVLPPFNSYYCIQGFSRQSCEGDRGVILSILIIVFRALDQPTPSASETQTLSSSFQFLLLYSTATTSTSFHSTFFFRFQFLLLYSVFENDKTPPAGTYSFNSYYCILIELGRLLFR